jgi:type III secretion protein C
MNESKRGDNVNRTTIQRRRALACIGLSTLGPLPGFALAAALDWPDGQRLTPIIARDMPLKDFLEALVSGQSVSVIVSPQLAGRVVNGRFAGTPDEALKSVVKTLSLLPYFDGGTLYVFAGGEVVRRSFQVPSSAAERVIGTLNQLQLHDSQFNTFTLVPTAGLLRVSGARPFVEQVQEVIRSASSGNASAREQIAVYRLRYAWAWDVTLVSAGRQIVVPGVATLLRSLLGRAGAVTVSPASKTVRSAGVTKLKGQGFRSGNTGDTAEARPAEPAPPFASGGGDEALLPNAAGPTVTAEVRTNSVVVRDTPDRLPQYAELVRTLDVEPVMVEIEAVIVDVNSDRLQELGVNWRILGDTSETRLGSGGVRDSQLRGPTPSDVTPTGRGLTWSTVRESGSLIARVTALAADGGAKVVSRAQVATMANLESSIQSSETTYIRVAGVNEVDLFPVTASTSVRVTPQVISRQGRPIVSMVVGIRDGTFTDAVTTGIPSVKEVSVSTNGLVADNQTFMIGGFKQERLSRRTDKIPLLGDIPILGAAFRTTSEQGARGERLFLLSPRVLTVREVIARQNAEIPSVPDPSWPSVLGIKPEVSTVERNAQNPHGLTSSELAACKAAGDDPATCRRGIDR